MEANHFLFIASDYKPWPGGIAEYLDSLARALISLGYTIKVLAVVPPDEKARIEYLETYEPWVIPFQLANDKKPVSWVGRKCVSLVEIVRCLSPKCRRALKWATVFETSTAAVAKLEMLLSMEKPTVVVFGHLDVNLYALALALLDHGVPYGIIAHGLEIGVPRRNRKNDLVKRGAMLRGACWIAANSFFITFPRVSMS